MQQLLTQKTYFSISSAPRLSDIFNGNFKSIASIETKIALRAATSRMSSADITDCLHFSHVSFAG